MKKKYIKLKIEIIEITEHTELLAGSDNDHWNHGHETACAHGAHAWFCNDD